MTKSITELTILMQQVVLLILIWKFLQTPVLEAFTNNRSSLKSRLISLTNNNLLFLPELVLNENSNNIKTQRTPETQRLHLVLSLFLLTHQLTTV